MRGAPLTRLTDGALAALADARTAWGFVLFGAAARTAYYLRDRSLWVDEAMLAKAIVERSYADLMKPLDYVQCSPLGFLWVERLLGSHLGYTEHVLRLFPLLCGLASLLLFHRLASRLLSATGATVAVVLFACTHSLVYYSAELKQYSTETAAGLALVLLAHRALSRPSDVAARLALIAAGLAAVAVSFSSVFLLAGVGLVWAASAFRSRSRADIALCVLAGLAWAGLLGLYYHAVIRHFDVARQVRAFGNYAVFWPLPPRGLSDLLWPLEAASGLMVNPLNTRYAGPGLLLIAYGSARLWADQRAYVQVVAVAAAAALLAAALGKYPLGGRLALYLVPYLLIGLSAGLDGVRVALGRERAGLFLLLLALFLVPAAGKTLALAAAPPRREEIKPMLARLEREALPGDALYVYGPSRPAFEHYRARYPRTAALPVVAAEEEGYGYDSVDADLAKLRGSRRVWLLFTRCGAGDKELCLREYTAHAAARGAERVVLESGDGAWLYRIDHAD